MMLKWVKKADPVECVSLDEELDIVPRELECVTVSGKYYVSQESIDDLMLELANAIRLLASLGVLGDRERLKQLQAFSRVRFNAETSSGDIEASMQPLWLDDREVEWLKALPWANKQKGE